MFKKRCDFFREQNQTLIEQKLPTSESSKSGEEMNCFIGQVTGAGLSALTHFLHPEQVQVLYQSRKHLLPNT